MRNTMNYFEPGQELETSIVQISGDTIFLDLNQKTEGILDSAEFTDKDGNLTVKEGDKIKVFYLSTKDDIPYFTTKITGQNADTDMLEKAFKAKIPVQGKVEKEIKGGFEIKFGSTRAFCPFSQMGFKQKQESNYYIGRTLPFQIQEFKDGAKNLVVSNRAVAEIEYQEKLQNLASNYSVGDIVSGKVIELKDKGAVVDIGKVQAFLPISEISRGHINQVSDKLSVGQEINAKIIKTDWAHEQISISTKELEANPWDTVEQRYAKGDKFDAIISRVTDFGLFVNLEDGIDGLVHISSLNLDANTNLKKKFTSGDKISVVIKSIDAKNKRISLVPSTSNEQDKATEKYMSTQNDDADTYSPFAALLKK